MRRKCAESPPRLRNTGRTEGRWGWGGGGREGGKVHLNMSTAENRIGPRSLIHLLSRISSYEWCAHFDMRVNHTTCSIWNESTNHMRVAFVDQLIQSTDWTGSMPWRRTNSKRLGLSPRPGNWGHDGDDFWWKLTPISSDFRHALILSNLIPPVNYQNVFSFFLSF